MFKICVKLLGRNGPDFKQPEILTPTPTPSLQRPVTAGLPRIGRPFVQILSDGREDILDLGKLVLEVGPVPCWVIDRCLAVVAL